MLGTILLVLCIQPLSNLIKPHSLSVHLFADDIQIETSILPQHVRSVIYSVEICISDIEEEGESKLYFNDLLHIHQHTFFKYMIQSVIEGKIINIKN